MVNPAHAYHVIGEISNQGNVKFMIDTGTAVSLIREDIWEKVAGSKPTLTAWTGCQLVGAEGSPIEIKGIATITFLIAGQSTRQFPGNKPVEQRGYPRPRLSRIKPVHNKCRATHRAPTRKSSDYFEGWG